MNILYSRFQTVLHIRQHASATWLDVDQASGEDLCE